MTTPAPTAAPTPAGSGSYVVRQGESVDSIAFEHGFFWETLWNHADNAELKRVRKDPNVLLPGDRLAIPEPTPKKVSASPGKRHRFRRKGVPAYLDVVFEHLGKPRKNEEYEIVIDGERRSGKLDAKGTLHETLPPNAREATVYLGPQREEFRFRLGGIDPVDTTTGLQQRLTALGYACGPIDGQLGDRTRAAISRFQSDRGQEPDGQPTDALRTELRNAYGS